jgi:TetR/AcrR family transcriptional repressor of mexJK operon
VDEYDESRGLLVRVAPRGSVGPALPGRGRQGAVARKRAAIVDAATRLFLDHGYVDTSTDQIAAAASVSKQTVYNQFGDKESLFREIIFGVAATAEQFAAAFADTLEHICGPDQLADALRALARRYLATVSDPQVLALRRLVIGEVHRFPELAATYYRHSPAHVLAALTTAFDRLTRRGLLAADHPDEAAEHFAHLVIGGLLDRGMFHHNVSLDAAQVQSRADRAVAVFLAGYGRADG